MNDAAKRLLTILDSLGEASRFCASGHVAPVLSGLQVQGVGTIGMPVSAADARKLIRQATRAPYGRGEQTIVDTGVRRVWQIEPKQFSLRNRAWQAFLDGIVGDVRNELGISRKVEARIYKLLIYERGGFFAPHRDTEKTPGMFATLVVCLPSRHRGGTLVITHDGQTERIDCGGKGSEFEVRYAAFYADCRHEITPVTDGYRVCLVYNLSITGLKRQPAAPANGAAVGAVADPLSQLFADDAVTKVAVLLKHQYSAAGLNPTALKGSDRAWFDILARAAARLDYEVHLALMTHLQEGSVDYSSWERPGSRYRSYRSRYSYFGDDDDIDEFDAEHSGSASFEEIFEESQTLDHWRDIGGKQRRLGRMKLEPHEVLSSLDEDHRPCTQQINEATGNEGVTMERSYRLGTIVIWPRRRYIRIMAAEGPASAVPALERMIVKAKSKAAMERCREFAAEIVKRWPARPGVGGADSPLPTRMLKLLEKLGPAGPMEHFFRDVFPNHANGSDGPALVRICSRFGWQANAGVLQDFFVKQTPENPWARLATSTKLFEALCCRPPALTDERRAVCAALAPEFERVIERFDRERNHEWNTERTRREGVIESVFRAFIALRAPDRIDRFLSRVLARGARYDFYAALVPAVQTLSSTVDAGSPGFDAFSRLKEHCIAALSARTSAPVMPPSDWRSDAGIACRCRDCRELVRFLEDPIERIHRFSIGKDRRRHLHGQIDRHACDLTHVTERKGRPETLVCAKTQKSYEQHRDQFAIDSRLLIALQSGAPHGKTATAGFRRLL